MLLMKSTGLVMLGAVGNLDAVFAQRIFPRIQPPEEEVQFQRVDLVLHQQDLESHLGREDQLVTLEQTPDNIYRDITKFQQDNCVPCCVLEHLESDGVCEVSHSVGNV